VQIVSYVLITILVITSFLMTLLILLHKGRGGGMSDMFGGGFSSSLGGSSLAEKNLDRITIAVALIWAAAIIAVGILITAL
jgi:preprotein translocase subunit SecG